MHVFTPLMYNFITSLCCRRRQTWSDGLRNTYAQYVDELCGIQWMIAVGSRVAVSARVCRQRDVLMLVDYARPSKMSAILLQPAGPSVFVFVRRVGLPTVGNPDSRARFPTGQLRGIKCISAGQIHSSGRQCSFRMALECLCRGPQSRLRFKAAATCTSAADATTVVWCQ